MLGVVQQRRDLRQREAKRSPDQDLLQSREVVVGVQPVAGLRPLAGRKQAELVVVVERAHGDARELGNFADGLHAPDRRPSREVRVKAGVSASREPSASGTAPARASARPGRRTASDRPWRSAATSSRRSPGVSLPLRPPATRTSVITRRRSCGSSRCQCRRASITTWAAASSRAIGTTRAAFKGLGATGSSVGGAGHYSPRVALTAIERPAAGDPQGLLVLHHGRGSDEQDLMGLAPVLDPERAPARRRAAGAAAPAGVARLPLVPGPAGRLSGPRQLPRRLRGAGDVPRPAVGADRHRSRADRARRLLDGNRDELCARPRRRPAGAGRHPRAVGVHPDRRRLAALARRSERHEGADRARPPRSGDPGRRSPARHGSCSSRPGSRSTTASRTRPTTSTRATSRGPWPGCTGCWQRTERGGAVAPPRSSQSVSYQLCSG